jgi:hypothetical protein
LTNTESWILTPDADHSKQCSIKHAIAAATSQYFFPFLKGKDLVHSFVKEKKSFLVRLIETWIKASTLDLEMLLQTRKKNIINCTDPLAKLARFIH